MNNKLITQTEGYLETALQQYSVTDAAMAVLEQELMSLKIKGIEDVEGYKAVRAGRMKVKGYRIDTEKTRKGLKEESLKFGKGVDGKAKQITERLLPIETYLSEMEKEVDAEKLRIKTEAETKAQERTQSRIKKLYDLGMVFDGFGYVIGEQNVTGERVRDMYDEEYNNLISEVEEVLKKNEEADRRKHEQEAEEKRRMEETREEQAAESKRLAAERDKLEAEKLAVEKAKQDVIDKKIRQAEIARAEQEAAAKALKEKEDQEKKEAEDKETERLLAETKEKLAKALRPDKEKLLAFADDIESIEIPELTHESTLEMLDRANGHLKRAIQILRQGA